MRSGRARHQGRPDAGHGDGAGEDRAERQYFIHRKLYPNVDFYSGIILKAMGFPTSMFTVSRSPAPSAGSASGAR